MCCVRYFRHPPLAAWTLVVVLLAVLLGVLGVHGAQQDVRAQVRVPDARGQVLALRDRGPALLGLLSAPDEHLHIWAEETAAITASHLTRRRAAGIPDDDPVSTGYIRVRSHALVLARVDLQDEDTIRTETKALLAELDNLVGATNSPAEPGPSPSLPTPTPSPSATPLALSARSSS